MRQLASIQKIKQLESIENAEAIERATVLGWQLVVKKGEFKVGELCVYVEIDAILPPNPDFEFLRPRNFRIRTIRLRGQISQGICFPLSILPEGTIIEESADVTEILGISKYEPPVPAQLAGVAKGLFPSFIPKTDETRVQVLEDLLARYASTPCFVTEKLDGSSVTFYWKDGVFGVCSRNLELIENDENSYWAFARQHNLAEKMAKLGKNMAIQGEIVGEGIQSNKYKLRGNTVFFFNAFDIDAFRYIDFEAYLEIFATMQLETVPILERNFVLKADIPVLVEYALGRSMLNANAHREGVVIRPLIEQNSHRVGRVSFKVINPEFLLKYEDA